MAVEKTFAMLKPGVLQRRIVGEVLSRIERKGLKLIALKMMSIPRALCEQHYAEHKDRPFFNDLVSYVTSGPVVAMVITGENAIAILRMLCGATRVNEAVPGTIRGDLGLDTQKNVIHASDSAESAAREIALFFESSEIQSYEDGNEAWYV